MKTVLMGWLIAHGLPGWLAPDYASMVGLAGIVGSVLVLRLARRDGVSVHLQARALLLAFIAAGVGGYVFEWIRAIPAALVQLSLTPILTAGRAAYGGLLAGVLVPALYLHKRGASPLAFLDRATLAMGALFAFVRVGCFLEGCDFGRPAASWLGVRFPPGSPAAEMHGFLGWVPIGHESLPVHPTELYEAALGIVASLGALVWLRRGRRDGAAFVTWIATYATGRLVLELLRGDTDRGVYAGLSTAQVVSIVLLVACTFAILRGRKVLRGFALVSAGALVVGGCVAEPTPPLGQLSLRDTLSAEPTVVASLPVDERTELARRFEVARAETHAPETVGGAGIVAATTDEQLVAVDDLRKKRGVDAMIAARLEAKDAQVRATPFAIELDPRDATPSTPLTVEGPAPTVTLDAEARALGGAAGMIVREAMRASGARHLVRVVGWPAALVVAGDTVYVNAAWLVAMGSVEPVPSTPPTTMPASGVGVSHPLLTLQGNTLELCVTAATQECNQCPQTDGGVCAGSVTLLDMPNVQAECAFLQADPLRFKELCGLYLVRFSGVASCLSTIPQCTLASGSLTSTSLPSAATFANDPACATKLDACLAGGGGGGGTPSSSSNSGCGCDCDKCCSDKGCGSLACKQGTGSCGKFCTDGQCKQCTLHPADSSRPRSPWALLWILPLLYLVRKARRRPTDR